jgi:hypothetical protein
MSLSLKQAIEGHPVIIYSAAVITGFVAGILLYKGALEMTGRTPASTDRYDVLVSENINAKKRISELEIQVASSRPREIVIKLRSVVSKPNKSCPPSQPMAVTESYDVEGDVDESRAIVITGSAFSDMFVYKVNENSAFRTDPTRRGWTFNYCETASSRYERVRIFVNPLTGASSKSISVLVET